MIAQIEESQGSVHGRFQPFHNEHLAYCLAALKVCQFVWVGITKYDLAAEISPLGRERERPENNPLTYFERVTIIAEALVESGIDRDRFGFTPFPIEHPSKLGQFLSTRIPCFTTICEQWNREKIGVLQKQGYDVRVLWERAKTVTGSAIREHILAGDDVWKTMVPLATVRAVETYDLRRRLEQLSGAQSVEIA